MKETIIDVLMYLFDNCVEDHYEMGEDEEALKLELIMAGFPDRQVNKAFEWLEGLLLQKEVVRKDAKFSTSAVRLFNHQEMEKLDTECRGFILFLEQAGVVSAHDRELILDRVMALETDEIELPQLKWIILMVLMNQSGKEAEYGLIEDIVMDTPRAGIH